MFVIDAINMLKLNIKQPDRMEEAWKWVLLGWGSKAEIIKQLTKLSISLKDCGDLEASQKKPTRPLVIKGPRRISYDP